MPVMREEGIGGIVNLSDDRASPEGYDNNACGPSFIVLLGMLRIVFQFHCCLSHLLNEYITYGTEKMEIGT